MHSFHSAAWTLVLCLAAVNHLPGRVEAFQLADNHPLRDISSVDSLDNEKATFRPPSDDSEDVYRAEDKDEEGYHMTDGNLEASFIKDTMYETMTSPVPSSNYVSCLCIPDYISI